MAIASAVAIVRSARLASERLTDVLRLSDLTRLADYSAEADALRTYRHVATLDPTAPLPPIPDREPDWRACAAAAEALGLGRLAGRLEEAASS